ncbi:tRNA guanosine(34) transglycosylase Tgt [Candidatus Peregrinibacteria bacterium CG10_big_fil_rev_8_21_14_0_10_49_16]|nr:MAG: tRNA guanosine(34) transglycosylase Tgt [Candidatus Peregrinibacteria bacterium CG10_big_fil_rev_8_21_14_0_10_49_16]
MFSLYTSSLAGRRGQLCTAHGTIETPFFFPVATAGAMKGISHQELLDLGAEVLLCNTYHLHLRPGEHVVADAGGLHKFIGWEKPILTDSGGFQVFSLRKIRSLDDSGVTFQSHLDGKELFLGPREAMEIQHALGADIIMVLDECPPSTADRSEIEQAVERTLRWAKECKRVHEELCRSVALRQAQCDTPFLFGIVQGGLEKDLREYCARELIAMDFDGYAIGGLAVGESEEEMYQVLDWVCPLLPEDKPRYLMGVGKLSQLPVCVSKGIDMFDCVLPMREARHGTVYVQEAKDSKDCVSFMYDTIRITNEKYMNDHSLIDPQSPSLLSRKHSKSYLCHLLRSGERYGETIACMQNMGMTLKVMKDVRENIRHPVE